MANLLPWPREAAIIVCATPATAKRELMDSVNPGVCRDCGCAVVYDSYSFDRCNREEITRGRPIEFLCFNRCYPKYDSNQIEISEDHTPEFKRANPS